MLDRQLTTQQAADILDVDERTVRRYRTAGLLPCKTVKRQAFFPKKAVESLAKVRKEGFKPISLMAQVASLQYTVNRLEAQMRFLLHRNDLLAADVEFSDQELEALYSASRDVPSNITVTQLRQWLDPVIYLQESEYHRLAALTGDAHPWKRMFDYCEKASALVKKKRSYKKNLDLQQIALDLALTQQHIRKCALILIETESYSVSASSRFDVLTSKRSKEIDPMEIIRNIKTSPQATGKDLDELRRLQLEYSESRASPLSDTEES